MEKEEQKNKFKELLRALKFGLISISAGIIQIGLFTLFNEVFFMGLLGCLFAKFTCIYFMEFYYQ